MYAKKMMIIVLLNTCICVVGADKKLLDTSEHPEAKGAPHTSPLLFDTYKNKGELDLIFYGFHIKNHPKQGYNLLCQALAQNRIDAATFYNRPAIRRDPDLYTDQQFFA